MGGHSTWEMSFFYINYVFAKFSPQVVNRCFYRIGGAKHGNHFFNIWLKTFKVSFLPHEDLWRGGLEYFGWQATPANISLSWSLKISKHFPTKLGLFVIKRSFVWFFLIGKLTDWSKLHRPSVSRKTHWGHLDTDFQ